MSLYISETLRTLPRASKRCAWERLTFRSLSNNTSLIGQ